MKTLAITLQLLLISLVSLTQSTQKFKYNFPFIGKVKSTKLCGGDCNPGSAFGKGVRQLTVDTWDPQLPSSNFTVMDIAKQYIGKTYDSTFSENQNELSFLTDKKTIVRDSTDLRPASTAGVSSEIKIKRTVSLNVEAEVDARMKQINALSLTPEQKQQIKTKLRSAYSKLSSTDISMTATIYSIELNSIENDKGFSHFNESDTFSVCREDIENNDKRMITAVCAVNFVIDATDSDIQKFEESLESSFTQVGLPVDISANLAASFSSETIKSLKAKGEFWKIISLNVMKVKGGKLVNPAASDY